MLSMLNECKISVVKGAVAAGQTEIADAAVVDMQGFENVAFLAVLGADTAATAKSTLSVLAGDKADMSDAAVKPKVAVHIASSATSDDDKVLLLDVVRPGKRYLRAKLARETANVAVSAILALQYDGDNIPVTQSADVLAAALNVG